MSGDNHNTAAPARDMIPKDGMVEEQNIVDEAPKQRGLSGRKWSSPESEIEDGEAAEAKRNKGTPWSIQEHTQFLQGMERYGRGAWKDISRNALPSRSPTQIASHAQKYFKRKDVHPQHKKRCSIHDITTLQQALALALAHLSNQFPSSSTSFNPYSNPPSSSQHPTTSFNSYLIPHPIASFNPYSNPLPTSFDPSSSQQPTTSFHPYSNPLSISSFNPFSSQQSTTSFNPDSNPQPIASFNPYSSQQPTTSFDPLPIASFNPSTSQYSTQTPLNYTTYLNPPHQTFSTHPPTPSMATTFLNGNAPYATAESPFMDGTGYSHAPNFPDMSITNDMFASGPSNPTMFVPEPSPTSNTENMSEYPPPPPPDAN